MTWDILAAQLTVFPHSSCCGVIFLGAALGHESLCISTLGLWEKEAGGRMPGSLGTVSRQYGSRMYLVMSQQKNCEEEEYVVR